MTPDTPLFSLLLDHFKRGFVIDEPLVHQAEALWGLLSPTELRQKLTDEELYSIGLAELVFVPEQSFRYAVERILPAGGLSDSACAELTEAVIAALSAVPLRLEDEGEEIAVTTVDDLVSLFVGELHLTYSVVLPEMEASPELGWRLRALLRERMPSLDSQEQEFVDRLVQGFCREVHVDQDLLLKALDYSLSLMADRAPGSDILERFTLQKLNLQKELAAAESFQQMYGSRYTKEFLMLSGVRVPAIDEAAAQEEVCLIDTICLTVFGRVAEGLEPMLHRHTEVKKDDSSVEKILRQLP